jgi:serine/threonine protein kinase
MALAPGSKFGAYSILGPLGSGGMGEVYRAFDTRLGREVALKTLPEAFAGDPERLARFEREARMLAALNHPAIAAIYGLEESEGLRFIVMELVPGDTLSERLSHGRSTRRSRSRARSPRRSRPRTSAGSSTGISSRRTSR